jgi:hypothetical protein
LAKWVCHFCGAMNFYHYNPTLLTMCCKLEVLQIMTWMNLTDFEDDDIYRGSVFCTPAKPPHEPLVELMVVEDVYWED